MTAIFGNCSHRLTEELTHTDTVTLMAVVGRVHLAVVTRGEGDEGVRG